MGRLNAGQRLMQSILARAKLKGFGIAATSSNRGDLHASRDTTIGTAGLWGGALRNTIPHSAPQLLKDWNNLMSQNNWFSGTGNPPNDNSLGQDPNDFYLNTSSDSVWQYQTPANVWVLLGSLSSPSNPISLKTDGVTNTSQTVLNLKSGTNVTLTADGVGGVTFDAASTTGPFLGPAPWYDLTNSAFGHVGPRSTPFQTTTATVTSGSANVTLASAIDFVNGDGIVIWKGGAATTQSTPSAPTVTSDAVRGSRTINYKLVGYDAMGGLTAASAAGSVTNAPACMGNAQVAITSINQSSGTVTVVTASALNGVVNGKVFIINTTGITGANGLQTIASISGTTLTFSLAGNAGAGGVSGAVAQLTNTFVCNSITRSGTTISITTDQAHGINKQNNLTDFTLALVSPNSGDDFGGYYTVLSASGSSLTLDTPISATETGLTGHTVTVFEYTTILGPSLSGTTKGYYIYADYANDGTYTLIANTSGGSGYYDYGPFFNAGFVAPGYVPITPPGAAQNQMLASIISSGGGTTSLVLQDTAGATVSGLSAIHDDGVILQHIAHVYLQPKTIYIPAQRTPGGGFTFVINSPITIDTDVDLWVGSGIQINETVTFAGGNRVTGFTQGFGQNLPQFAGETYCSFTGIAGIMLNAPNGGFSMRGIELNTSSSNGTVGLVVAGLGGFIENCAFECGSNSMNVGLRTGNNQFKITDCTFVAGFGVNNSQNIGQGFNQVFGPPLPSFKCFASQTLMDGMNVFYGRGVRVSGNRVLLNIYEFQAPSTPAVWSYALSTTNLIIKNVINDSLTTAVYANWTNISQGQESQSVVIDGVNTSPGTYNIVTGSLIAGLTFRNTEQQTIGQNRKFRHDIVNKANIGAPGFQQNQPISYQGWPILLSGPDIPCVAVQILPPTGLTSAASGAGTWSAGTGYQMQITTVGWNGGESQGSALTPAVTVNGSQGIQLSWNAVSGAKGYNVYYLGVLQTATPVQATSITMASSSSNGSVFPLIDGTGFPLIDANQVATPLVRLPNGLFKVDVSSGALTANRAVTMPDAGGTVLVEETTGFGSGAAGTAVTTTIKGGGTGPSTPQTVIQYAEVNIGGTQYWIPLCQ